MSLLFTILITSLVVCGVRLLIRGNQFPVVSRFVTRLGVWDKPIGSCIPCMSGSLWNGIVVTGVTMMGWYEWVDVPVVLVLNGLSTVFLASLLDEVYYRISNMW